MSWYRVVQGFVAMGVVLGFARVAEAQGCSPAACTGYTQVDHTFASGSRWNLTVQNCPCEGLVIQTASYTPRGGTSQLVLGRGSIAEIHVPYAVGTPRPLDVANAGLGYNALTLTAAECAGGTLLANNQICQNIEDRGYAWKYMNTFQHGESLSVSMASQLGQYTYINLWEFHDDGTIEPRVGLSGRLQRVLSGTAYAPHGSRLDSETNAIPAYGISHLHNVYYRLDFDIRGPKNDVVEQMTFQPSTSPSPDSSCSTPGTCGVNVRTPILLEAAQDFVPESYTSWFIYDKTLTNSDGRSVGYELVPHIEGLWTGQVSTTEPWSAHELWVTRYHWCEMLAVGNFPPHIDSSCSSAPTNVSAMVDGQSVDGHDVVVWYVNRHLHVPRDEDQTNMPIKWLSFEIKPRNFHHKNPLEP
uniref:Amine oxidase n=1 Tax=Vitiosangium cumulatum TaxID=1867796 RepID=A0A7D4XH89_9BACT|nr:amine oxidase [Vitiosangium cumulatum]